MSDIVERLRGHDHRTGGDGRSIWAEAAGEIERLRGIIRAYLDYCAPEEKWQGEPTLLRIRRQMRAALLIAALPEVHAALSNDPSVGPAAGEPVTGYIDADAPHISAQGNDK
jgi:hypothetical protein